MAPNVEHYLTSSWIIAGLFVVFHSWRRFDTPPTNRASTTPERYYVALAAYVFASLAAYSLLALSPEFMHDVMPQAAQALFSEAARGIGAPFFGALFVTVLLPAIPVLSEPEIWLRGVLQDLAAIPYQAVRLTKRLQAADLQLSSHIRTEITDVMVNDGIDPQLIVFENSRTLESTWTRICSLIHVLRDWDNEDRRLVAFRRAFRGDYAELLDRHHQLTTVFSMVTSSPTLVNDVRFNTALNEMRSRFGAQIRALHKDVCQFIAMGVLRCRMTDAKRSSELKRLGFAIGSHHERGGLFDKCIGLFLLLAAYFTVVMVEFATEVPGVGKRFLLGLMVAAIYCAAVVCALYATRDSHVGEDGQRPWSRYLLAALVAAAVSIMTNFGMTVILTGTIKAAAEGLRITLPWSLLAFVTALATCFNCDTINVPPRLRWLEGVGQAAVTALTGILVWSLLNQVQGAVTVKVPLPRVVFNSLFAGFVIGVDIPTWYRVHRAQAAEIEDLIDPEEKMLAA